MYVLSLDYITCINVESFVSQYNVTFLVEYCGNEDLDYGTVTYQWDFGDGNTVSSTFPFIFHHYQTPRTWTYRLITSNAVSEVPLTRSVNIEAGTYFTMMNVTYKPCIHLYYYKYFKRCSQDSLEDCLNLDVEIPSVFPPQPVPR